MTTTSPRRLVAALALLLSALLGASLVGTSPAQAAPDHRIAKLRTAVKNAKTALADVRRSLSAAQDEAGRTGAALTQAGMATQSAVAAYTAASATAASDQATLAAAVRALDAARAAQTVAVNRHQQTQQDANAADAAYQAATAVERQASDNYAAASRALDQARQNVDDERAKWNACRHKFGNDNQPFECRKTANSPYEDNPALDRKVAARDQAAGDKAQRLDEYNADAAQSSARLNELRNAQATNDAAANAENAATAAASSAAAVVTAAQQKSQQSDAARTAANGRATAAQAGFGTAQKAVAQARGDVDRLMPKVAAAANRLDKAKEHLRYVKKQYARRR